jgi:hypothetical protein
MIFVPGANTLQYPPPRLSKRCGTLGKRHHFRRQFQSRLHYSPEARPLFNNKDGGWRFGAGRPELVDSQPTANYDVTDNLAIAYGCMIETRPAAESPSPFFWAAFVVQLFTHRQRLSGRRPRRNQHADGHPLCPFQRPDDLECRLRLGSVTMSGIRRPARPESRPTR